MLPSAVTTSAASRLSTVSPCLRMSQPMPPPKVTPPTPVWLTMPPVVASPCACLVVDIAPQGATLHPGGATGPVDPHGPHPGEVDDDAVVAHRGARHVMSPAPYGDVEVVVTGEAHGRGRVSGPTAPGDDPGAPVVPFHSSGRVVLGGQGDQLALDPSISIVAASSPTGRPACSPAGHRCSTASAHHRGPRLWSQESGLPSRGLGRDSGTVRTYGQYCPIARGAEIFAERWTPLIIRNLWLGCGTFSEILEGAPGLSRTLLSQRLKHLERLGIVESTAKPDGRGRYYELTPAGHDLFAVCKSLGEWGAHWLEIAPEHLDPSWLCGRCATRSAETVSRKDESSSAWTSRVARATSGTG